MGQILHGCAKATHAIRGELQRSEASVASLAKRFGINEKTVIKSPEDNNAKLSRKPAYTVS